MVQKSFVIHASVPQIVLTRKLVRVYVFRCQKRVNSKVNSVFDEIEKFDEFDRVNTH